MTDCFCGWPLMVPCMVAPCRCTRTTEVVIRTPKDWLFDKGVPVPITSDGGAQFSFSSFAKSCKDWGIQHDPSSLHHHHTNGAAEAAMKAVKAVIEKCSPYRNLQGDAFSLGIIQFCNTQRLSPDWLSPAALVYRRQVRSDVLTQHKVFKEEWKENNERLTGKPSPRDKKRQSTLTAKARACHRSPAVMRVQHPKTKQWAEVAEVIDVDRPQLHRQYEKRARVLVQLTFSSRILSTHRMSLPLFLSLKLLISIPLHLQEHVNINIPLSN